MLLRFHTYEEACIFSARKRADGYFAEVIHENFGHIYGEMAANGFAVILSDESAPEGDALPVSEGPVPPLSEMGKMVAMLGLLGMLGGVAIFLFLVAVMVMGFVALPVKIQVCFIVFALILFLFLWTALKVTRIYRRPEHPLYFFSRFIINSIAWVYIISGDFLLVIFMIWYLEFGN